MNNELSVLQRPPQSPDLNPVEHLGCGRMSDWQHECAVDRSEEMMYAIKHGPEYQRNV